MMRILVSYSMETNETKNGSLAEGGCDEWRSKIGARMNFHATALDAHTMRHIVRRQERVIIRNGEYERDIQRHLKVASCWTRPPVGPRVSFGKVFYVWQCGRRIKLARHAVVALATVLVVDSFECALGRCRDMVGNTSGDRLGLGRNVVLGKRRVRQENKRLVEQV